MNKQHTHYNIFIKIFIKDGRFSWFRCDNEATDDASFYAFVRKLFTLEQKFFRKASKNDSFYRFLMQILLNSKEETIKLKHLSALSVVVPHSLFRSLMERFQSVETL